MPIDPNIALSVKPPQLENPIQQFGNLLALKAAVQQQAAGKLQLQHEQMAVNAEQAQNDAWKQSVTIAPDGTPSIDKAKMTQYLSSHGAGSSIAAVMKHFTDMEKSAMDLQKLKGEVANQESDYVGSIAAASKEASNDPGVFLAGATHALALGYKTVVPVIDAVQKDPSKLPAILDHLIAQSPAQQKLATERMSAQGSKDRGDAAMANSEREQKQFDINRPKLEAEAAIAQNKLKLIQDAKPEDYAALVDQIAPPGVPENTALNSRLKAQTAFYLKKGDLEGAKQALTAGASEVRQLEVATDPRVKANKIAITVAGQQARNEAATPSGGGLDLMAEQALSGQFTFTSRNPVLMTKVYDRAAELAKERGMNAQQAIMERNSAQASNSALKAVTKQYETLKPFADMAEKNAAILEKKMAEVSDLGTSLLNTPLRALEGKFGSTKVAALKAALLPVQADFARLLNSPTGGGELSDHARAEMQGAMQGGATVGQIKAALDVFRADAKNRRDSFSATIADLKQRSVSGGGKGGSEKTPGAAPTHRFNPATGKIEAVAP